MVPLDPGTQVNTRSNQPHLMRIKELTKEQKQGEKTRVKGRKKEIKQENHENFLRRQWRKESPAPPDFWHG